MTGMKFTCIWVRLKKRVVLKQTLDNFSTKAAFFAAYMMLNFRDKQRALTALY